MRRLSMTGLALCAMLAASTALYAQQPSTLSGGGGPAVVGGNSQQPETIPEGSSNVTDCCKELRKEVVQLRQDLSVLEARHNKEIASLNGQIGANAKAIGGLIPAIKANTTGVGTNSSGVATNKANIASTAV